MKDCYGLKKSSIILALIGLFWTLAQNSLGPIIMVAGITMVTFIIFKGKNHDRLAGIIMLVALVTMLIMEYFLVPLQNTLFYISLFTISLGIFLTFYYSLKPQNIPSKQVKFLSWTGCILFMISFFILIGINFNNFSFSIIMGIGVSIILVTGLLIRRGILKDEAIVELNEGLTTGNTEKYWFKYESGGGPKPVRWQGWVCGAIFFISPLVMVFFARNIEMAIVLVFAIIVLFSVLIMLKSNYKEIMIKYSENFKK